MQEQDQLETAQPDLGEFEWALVTLDGEGNISSVYSSGLTEEQARVDLQEWVDHAGIADRFFLAKRPMPGQFEVVR